MICTKPAVLTLQVWREVCCELPKVCEFLAQLQLRTIEQHRQDCLCSAGIVDHLLGKEDPGGS